MIKKFIFFFGFICFFSIVTCFFYLALKKSNFREENNIIIEQPQDLNNISQIFLSNGIGHPLINKFIIRLGNIVGYKLKFGEYSLPKNVSLWNAIQIISLGKQVVHKFCIPEGFSVIRIIKKLNDNKFLQGEIVSIPEEGSLLPDTYCFKYPTTKQEIIKQAQYAMNEFIKIEWEKRSPVCFLKSPKEALILASIVEKESNIKRDIVAGMYLHRLKKQMKLQACPTVIYSMVKGDKFSRKLTYNDLKIDSPYNTYRYLGLPPSPITNPGKAAILAVLHPKQTDALFMYFDGSTSEPVFSKSYDEHKQNIAKIRNIDLSQVK